jgi:hypothetical protein
MTAPETASDLPPSITSRLDSRTSNRRRRVEAIRENPDRWYRWQKLDICSVKRRYKLVQARATLVDHFGNKPAVMGFEISTITEDGWCYLNVRYNPDQIKEGEREKWEQKVKDKRARNRDRVRLYREIQRGD